MRFRRRRRKWLEYWRNFPERYTADFRTVSEFADRFGLTSTYLDTAPSASVEWVGLWYDGARYAR